MMHQVRGTLCFWNSFMCWTRCIDYALSQPHVWLQWSLCSLNPVISGCLADIITRRRRWLKHRVRSAKRQTRTWQAALNKSVLLLRRSSSRSTSDRENMVFCFSHLLYNLSLCTHNVKISLITGKKMWNVICFDLYVFHVE